MKNNASRPLPPAPMTRIVERLVECPGPPYAEGIMRVVAVEPEDFNRLHALVVNNGIMKAGDAGDAENGPDFYYDGHKLGKRITGHFNDKTGITLQHRGRPTTLITTPEHYLRMCAEIARPF